MNEQVLNLLSQAIERSSITIALCFLMTNVTTILVVWLKKSKIKVSHNEESCEFHREDEQAMSVFKTFRNPKTDDKDAFRNAS